LLVAAGLNADISGDVAMKCLENGLLVNPVKPNALRFIPPLIATEKDVDKALSILEKVIKER
jgi:4-aminobutyrate aminotransferase-like enzyme